MSRDFFAPSSVRYMNICALVYISGRSFVLRDAAEPRTTLYMSDRAENLEDIERRLKEDILQEAAKCVDVSSSRLTLFRNITLGLED